MVAVAACHGLPVLDGMGSGGGWENVQDDGRTHIEQLVGNPSTVYTESPVTKFVARE